MTIFIDQSKDGSKRAVFSFSVQHSVVYCRHLPDDSGCRRSFYDPASEYFGIFGFEPKSQRDDHFKIVPLDDIFVSAAGAANNAVCVQNAAFEYHSDIRAYGSSEYSEQVGNLSLSKPCSVCGRANRYPSVFDRYGLSHHIHLILYRFFIEFELSAR